LDIGCGTGDRLEVFKEKGFQVFGIETSASAQHARKRLGPTITQGTLENTDFPDSFFDLLSLYNVLEHVHNPDYILAQVRRILKPNGFLIIEVPNSESFQRRLFKAKWAAYDVPRDLFYFNQKNLRELLNKTGYEVKAFDLMNNFWHPPTLVTSAFPILDPQLSWARQEKNLHTLHLKLLWVAATLLASPIAFIEGMFKRSALMTCYASPKKN
jgi:SAM-dependent methyltransferase